MFLSYVYFYIKVKDFCAERNISLVFIPGRMTNLLQPADVGWFSVIKKAYKSVWNNWFMNADKTFTTSKNMKSPGYVKCLEWIDKIWQDFRPSVISKSFEACGIHEHGYVNGELCVRFDNIHSMLKMFVQNKVTTLL